MKSKKGKKNKNATRLRHLGKYNRWVFLPDDPFKIRWDLFVMMLLVYTFIATPYRIAFEG
jgi:hypothetical protein